MTTYEQAREVGLLNVLVISADPAAGEDYCRQLTATPGLRCCGVASSLADGLELLSPGNAQAIVVAGALPDAGIWTAVRAFREADPRAPVVVMSPHDIPGGEVASTAPAPPSTVPASVADWGESPLTPREHEVLVLLGRGLDPANIARELDLSIHTARGHVKRILAKLGAHSQLEAVVIATKRGLLPAMGES
jgi:DNA-binding NarL/FixJ family response regulator